MLIADSNIQEWRKRFCKKLLNLTRQGVPIFWTDESEAYILVYSTFILDTIFNLGHLNVNHRPRKLLFNKTIISAMQV